MKLNLRYFPFPGRAAAIRDAFQLGNIEFQDEHIAFDQFKEKRAAAEFPFGSLPVLDIEVDGEKICSAQSNAILRYAGRLAGLYPINNPIEALKVDEILDLGEDINAKVGHSIHEKDEARKMAMRKVLAEETLPYIAECLERLITRNGNTGFLVGEQLTIADLKLYWIQDWLSKGLLDGIPTTLFDKYPSIMSWRENIKKIRAEKLA